MRRRGGKQIVATAARRGMVDQPSVHHLARCLPDDVVLHKVLVLVHPRFHPCMLCIVDGRGVRVPVVVVRVMVVCMTVVVVAMLGHTGRLWGRGGGCRCRRGHWRGRRMQQGVSTYYSISAFGCGGATVGLCCAHPLLHHHSILRFLYAS